MILLTTSDYFPQLGGLSTFTQNIETALRELNLEYRLFHWKRYGEIQNISKNELSQYEFIINVHPQFAWLSSFHHEKMINFIHGSEILMTSPNVIKKFFKKINKYKYFSKLELSYLNIFISESTFNKATESGLTADYSRDLIFHNCIDVKDAIYINKKIVNNLSFSCIVRNVAHKNLAGSLKFCEMVTEVTGKSVELIVPHGSRIVSSKIFINELSGHEDYLRDNSYKKAHYNLLLSLDHSSKGYFEGFGLTVLEAARFGTPSIVMNTGGLSESVHSNVTGWVVDQISNESVAKIFSDEQLEQYSKISKNCYEHTLKSHSLKEYIQLFGSIFNQAGAA